MNGSSVILQLPAKLPQQLLELTAKDASGRLVAATYLAAPQYVYPSLHSLVTSDGASIDANHPVSPGDRAVLRITGTGLGNALFDLVSGAKQFQVVRSGFRNGYEPQFEIEFVIPRLYDGQHYLWLHMAHVSTGALPLWVKNPPPVN